MGYTKKELITQLKAEAKRLGKTPRWRDIDSSFVAGRTVNPETIQSVFGSWSKALEAAGLSLNREKFSKEDLIAQLQAVAKRLGSVPRQGDVDSSGAAGSWHFKSAFGSWNDALKEAGLTAGSRSKFSKDALIAQLKAEAELLGRTPCQEDISLSSAVGKAGVSVYYGAFGSWNKALEAAGFPVNRKGRR